MERTLPAVKEVVMAPHARTMDEELDEASLVRSILYDGITELSCKCEASLLVMHTCILTFEALSLVEARLKQVYSQLKRPVTIVQSHGSANRMQPPVHYSMQPGCCNR